MLKNKMQDGSMKFESKFTSCELFTVGFLLWLSIPFQTPFRLPLKWNVLASLVYSCFISELCCMLDPSLLDPSHSYPLFLVLAQIHFIYSDAHCSIDQCLMSLLNYWVDLVFIWWSIQWYMINKKDPRFSSTKEQCGSHNVLIYKFLLCFVLHTHK